MYIVMAWGSPSVVKATISRVFHRSSSQKENQNRAGNGAAWYFAQQVVIAGNAHAAPRPIVASYKMNNRCTTSTNQSGTEAGSSGV
jgi:hypothetical protein